MIDLDSLCFGEPTWEEVVEFWKDGEFCEEKYLVEAIELHLLTEAQRKTMYDHRLSIEKMLNGRHTGDKEPVVHCIFGEWNTKLGFTAFGA